MSSTNKVSSDAVPEVVRELANDLATICRQVEPILRELTVRLEPLMRSLKTAAPLVQAVDLELAKLDTAESLLERGWVPNQTTPFDLVAECGNDGPMLQTSLLAYYTDNWSEVRTRLESRLSSYDIDDEAKATFGEALDAHEAGFYRAVNRLLFPEFERLFRAALFDGRAGNIRYNEFMKTLVSDKEADHLGLGDFLIAGLQDMVLFEYLTKGVKKPSASADGSSDVTPEYMPGLAVRVDNTNIALARQSPIPTRHAVAHGLVTYSSQQSSLNAIFIADYIFSVVSQVLRRLA